MVTVLRSFTDRDCRVLVHSVVGEHERRGLPAPTLAQVVSRVPLGPDQVAPASLRRIFFDIRAGREPRPA